MALFPHSRFSNEQESGEHSSSHAFSKRDAWYQKMIGEVEDYAIILLDRSGNIQNWNKGAEKIKGYTEEEIVGKSFRNFYMLEDRNAGLPEKLLIEAINHRKAIHEGWRLRKDGTRFWGSIVLTAIHDQIDNVIGFSKVTRDLTERKLAEDKLNEYALELKRKNEELLLSEERYHKMIDEVEDYAIILLDREGIIQNWNKGAEKIKGYHDTEIVGKNFNTFYLPADRESGLPEKLLAQAVRVGKALHEGWRTRKDGSKFWGSIVLTALHDKEGDLIGFSKVTRDLTERKLAEDKLKEYTSQLEFQNRELEQFTYAASHDLKEPLRKIELYNSFIQEHSGDVLDAQSKQFLQRSINAVKGMSQLIEDLLSYSKTTNNLEVFQRVDLNDIIEEVKIILKEECEQLEISFNVQQLPVIDAIPFQIRQLMINLLNNSIKYRNPEKRLVIQIESTEVDAADLAEASLGPCHKFIKISVIDNGMGFDQTYSDKIFKIFHRLSYQPFKGSGIGLAICKRIVQNHHGYIKAAGETNVGAKFDIYFPENQNSSNVQQ